jgi:hypothetical protein
VSENYEKLRTQYDDITARQQQRIITDAYNRGVDDAKDAVRLEGSDKWEGSEFKPYFITAIARYCGPNRAAGYQCDACGGIVNEISVSQSSAGVEGLFCHTCRHGKGCKCEDDQPDPVDALCSALETAINTVECASLGADGEELPWYRQAHTALELAGRPWRVTSAK